MSEKLAQKYSRRLATARAKIEKFQAEVELDPAHALSWGIGAFAAAAEIRVLRQVVADFESGATAAEVKSWLMSHVIQGSRTPAHSTSPTSNLIEQYVLASYAEVLGDLQHV